MRIAFNTLIENPYIPSGSTDFYIQITRELARLDRENEYYLLVSNANRHLYRTEKENVHLVNCFVSNESPLLRILLSQMLVPVRLLQHKIAILYSPQNISALYVPRRVRNVISIISTHHWKTPDSIGSIRSLYRSTISRLARSQADVLIANSFAAKKDIVAHLKVAPEKVRVVYEGLDHSRFYPGGLSNKEEHDLVTLGVGKPFILFVSTIWYYKNAHTLIEAFGRLCQRTDLHHQLILVGRHEKTEGTNKKYIDFLLEICSRYKILDRVKFVGHIPNEEIAKFYKAADLYVQPSMHETFGKTVTEAFACGVPVIASNVGATAEIVGDAGMLFNPTNPHMLAGMMGEVLSNSHLKATLIRKGLKRAAEFSFTKQAGELMALFEELD